MNTAAGSAREAEGFRFTSGVRRRLVQIAGLILMQALALFASAGTLRWAEGWAYLGFYLFLIGLNAALIVPRGVVGSTLVEERSRAGGMRGWDKAFAAVYGLSSIAILVIAGLDERLAWSGPIAPWLQVLAFGVMCLGYGLFSWSMAVNAFFSARVRIQADRGHQVVDRGPYAAVRHPGYAGAVVSALTLPVMLGSAWALLPAASVVVSVIIRTVLEDRTLLAELDGYEDYSRRVRYRLVPGIW
jgi:protein-S-isoprenylcysteine O-methyltransferase Ste14